MIVPNEMNAWRRVCRQGVCRAKRRHRAHPPESIRRGLKCLRLHVESENTAVGADLLVKKKSVMAVSRCQVEGGVAGAQNFGKQTLRPWDDSRQVSGHGSISVAAADCRLFLRGNLGIDHFTMRQAQQGGHLASQRLFIHVHHSVGKNDPP